MIGREEHLKALNRFYPSGSRLGCIKKLESENLCLFVFFFFGGGGGGASGVGVSRIGGRVRKAPAI